MNAQSHAGHAGDSPSPWIVRFAPLVRPHGDVIDLACGQGRHARLFAARGARVVAVDRDSAALARLAGISGVETRELDLEGGTWPLSGERFDGVVVSNYLYRPRLDELIDLVAPDGVLLYETFAAGNAVYGRPSNPAFLLERDELAERARGRLTVVGFEQGRAASKDRSVVVQRLAAVGSGRAWPPELPDGPRQGVRDGETR